MLPLALNATLAGTTPDVEEDKYHRFTLDYPDANLSGRETFDGPTIEITVPDDIRTDSHIFFRLVAGDSQVTKSPKVIDIVSRSRD